MLPRHRYAHRYYDNHRNLRVRTILNPRATDELPGPYLLRTFQRTKTKKRLNNQGRQQTCAAPAHRNKLALSTSTQSNKQSTETTQKNQPQWAINIADKAGQRLRKRYRHLINNGKMPFKATIALARELAGFIWAVFNEYQARNNKKVAWRVKTKRNRLRRGCFDLFNHPPAEARLFDFWYLKIE